MSHLSYKVKLHIAGAPTALLNEPMEVIKTEGGFDYVRIIDESKRSLVGTASISIQNDGSSAPVTYINFLHGYVVMPTNVDPSYTITGSYYPLVEFADVTSHGITQGSDEIDVTTYKSANDTGYKQYVTGFKDIEISIGGLYYNDVETEFINEYVGENTEVLFEYRGPGGVPSKKGWVVFSGVENNGSITDKEEINYSGKISGLDIAKGSTTFSGRDLWSVIYNWEDISIPSWLLT